MPRGDPPIEITRESFCFRSSNTPSARSCDGCCVFVTRSPLRRCGTDWNGSVIGGRHDAWVVGVLGKRYRHTSTTRERVFCREIPLARMLKPQPTGCWMVGLWLFVR